MANEITLLDARSSPTDGTFVNVCFRYDIAVPKQVGGATVVVTPSAALPTLAAQALAPAEKAALDTGTAAFEIVEFHYNTAETGLQNLTRLRSVYATRKAIFDAAYTRRFQRAGTQFSAT